MEYSLFLVWLIWVIPGVITFLWRVIEEHDSFKNAFGIAVFWPIGLFFFLLKFAVRSTIIYCKEFFND